jgi:hypothetical protein
VTAPHHLSSAQAGRLSGLVIVIFYGAVSIASHFRLDSSCVGTNRCDLEGLTSNSGEDCILSLLDLAWAGGQASCWGLSRSHCRRCSAIFQTGGWQR